MTENVPRPRGRPPKKVQRPSPHPDYKGRGTITAEGWGYIRCFVEQHKHEWSWEDLACYFDVPQSTLRSHMGRPLGESTKSAASKRGRSESNEATITARQESIRALLKEDPMMRTRDIGLKLEVSK